MRKGRFASPDQQAQEFVKGWRMLRQFLCRHLKRKSIPFIAIFEKHESGWPHLHILLRGGYIDHRLIRRWWEHRFNSFKIDVRLAKGPHQSAAYVTKYVSGDPFKFEGVKRYWRSQDWLPPKEEQEKPVLDEYTWWEVENCRPYVMAMAALESGARVTFRHPKIIIENWDAVSRERWGLG